MAGRLVLHPDSCCIGNESGFDASSGPACQSIARWQTRRSWPASNSIDFPPATIKCTYFNGSVVVSGRPKNTPRLLCLVVDVTDNAVVVRRLERLSVKRRSIQGDRNACCLQTASRACVSRSLAQLFYIPQSLHRRHPACSACRVYLQMTRPSYSSG
jgi:hypothetical protein